MLNLGFRLVYCGCGLVLVLCLFVYLCGMDFVVVVD